MHRVVAQLARKVNRSHITENEDAGRLQNPRYLLQQFALLVHVVKYFVRRNDVYREIVERQALELKIDVIASEIIVFHAIVSYVEPVGSLRRYVQ